MSAAVGPAITETAWMDWIAEIAHTWGWTLAHFRPARTIHGWRTAVGYDGKGFPDLVLIHPIRRRVIFAEVKTDRGRLDDDQATWRNKLVSAGADWHLWQPKDRPAVVELLSFGQAVSVL